MITLVSKPLKLLIPLRLKDNPVGAESPFTFHPYLGIAQWLVATGKEGELVEWVSFQFGGLENSFCWRILLQAGSEDVSLLSLSLSLWLDRRPVYVFVLVWFLLGALVYFIFFVHFGIHSRLSNDCLWYVCDGGYESWELGRWGGSLLPVNWFFFCFVNSYWLMMQLYVVLECIDKPTRCNTSYEWSLLFINRLCMFRTITSPSSGASSHKLYNASQTSLAASSTSTQQLDSPARTYQCVIQFMRWWCWW